MTLEGPIVEVPFQLRDTFPVPLVEVHIGDRGPYLFAVNTAAACTVLLRRRLVDELGLEQVGTARVADASGRPSRPAETVRLPELRFGGVVARDLVAISHTPSAAHAASIPDDTDGILGRVLFESLLLTLDYPRRRLVLSEDRLEAGPAITPFELVQDVMQLNVDVAGRSIPVLLDSGHRGTVTLPRSWADLLPLGGPLVDAGQTATVNATYTRQTAPLTGAIVVAGARVESPLIYFADEHTPKLLGGGLLREFAITIDQRSRLVRFERGEGGKRAHPASPLASPPGDPRRERSAIALPGMSAILVVATVQSWFLAALVASRRDRRLSDTVLVIWLGLMGLHTGLYYVLPRLEASLPWVSALNSAFPFLQGPMLYFYVDTLTASRRRLPTSFLWHLLPRPPSSPTWGGSSRRPRRGRTAARAASTSSPSPDSSPVSCCCRCRSTSPGLCSSSVGTAGGWRRRSLPRSTSTSAGCARSWAGSASSGSWSSGRFSCARRSETTRRTYRPTSSSGPSPCSCTPSATRPSAEAVRLRAGGGDPELPDPAGGKYLKSGLPEDEARELHQRLLGFMEGERPWLDDSLDLPALAAALDTSANHVSQVLNGLEGKSFYDFVNGYRVAAVKERLADQGEGPSSLLDVALACGFRSKATFNRIFKQHTGLTPTQYRALR